MLLSFVCYHDKLGFTAAFWLCSCLKIVIKFASLRREEFIYREADAFKQVTGVVVGCANALFLRNAEVISRNQELYPALQLDDGEKT